MDTFSACVAFGPLAIYLLLLGLIHQSRRALVVGGTRESIALALALFGLIAVGPMNLFMPQQAATRFGPWVWALLVSFYILCVTLWLIVSRPRLIVYNIAPDQLREALDAAARRLDPETIWAGRGLSMPLARVHLQIDPFEAMGNVSLTATSDSQSITGWRRLHAALAEQLRGVTVAPHPHRYWLLVWGLLILSALGLKVADDPQVIAQGLLRMLNP